VVIIDYLFVSYKMINFRNDQDKRCRHFWDIYHTLDRGENHVVLATSWRLFDPAQKVYFNRLAVADKFRIALDELITHFCADTIDHHLPIIHDAIFKAQAVRKLYLQTVTSSRSTRIKLDIWVDCLRTKYLAFVAASEMRKKLDTNPFDPTSDIFNHLNG
jgi:hypothetical protein